MEIYTGSVWVPHLHKSISLQLPRHLHSTMNKVDKEFQVKQYQIVLVQYLQQMIENIGLIKK